MRSINGERSLFMVYVVFLLVSFSVMQVNHALKLAEKVGAIQENNSNGGGSGDERYNSQYEVELCRKDSIQVTQGQSGTLNGIPVYSVTIINTCNSGSCLNIHLSCGWFSSTRLINPAIFRRLGYNDCLVNNGKPLKPGQLLNFQYSNTFSYPLAVSSISCN
ncbi:TPD1 protein homolog 1-like [Nicotiana tabacum]|uniref:TPD1 protein homolog 1-like n=1 Tax=Nicotiana tabacum TaxID=4097 RepID=A0AC58SJJ8_TOBAC